jgi:hypothetical protein
MRAQRIVSVLAAAGLLAGCSEDFPPGSVLDDLRVLALVADPPEAGPGETVTVRAHVYVRPDDPLLPPPAPGDDPLRPRCPGGPAKAETWTFCPLTSGPSTGYRCLAPACDFPLEPAADGSVSAVPSQLALECLALLGGSFPSDPGAGGLPEQVETVFRYTVRSSSCATREAVARVPLFTAGPPAVRNLAPVIAGVDLAGVTAAPDTTAASARAGEKVPMVVRIDPRSIQDYFDAAGRKVTETVVVEVFSTAGRFDADRGSAPAAAFELKLEKLPAGLTTAVVYVVARDLRGGQAVAGPFRIAIVP